MGGRIAAKNRVRGAGQMNIAVPKEIKDSENRVALTPAGVATLVEKGHHVFIEAGAGVGSGFGDDDYRARGATIVADHAETFASGELVLKVKEPLPPEYGLLTSAQVLFTYLHLAPEPHLTRALAQSGVTAIAYETVQLPNGALPLLTPMSEIAGKMATQVGAHFLEKPYGGRGVLLGGVPGVPAGEVVIVGGGTVGTNAAKVALGMGARVTILDVNLDRLRYLDDLFEGRVTTLASTSANTGEAVAQADLLIGAVLVPGAKAPRLVSEDMVKAMKPGAVIVDVAIDQGGSIATIDRVTTHREPTYVKHGVVHYSVANMPGAVARTSTFALTAATLPYAWELANKGWVAAVRSNPALARGVNVTGGRITYQAVAAAHGLEYTPLEKCIA